MSEYNDPQTRSQSISSTHSRTSSTSSSHSSYDLSRSRTISNASSSNSSLARRRLSQAKRPWQLLHVVVSDGPVYTREKKKDQPAPNWTGGTRSPYPTQGRKNFNRV